MRTLLILSGFPCKQGVIFLLLSPRFSHLWFLVFLYVSVCGSLCIHFDWRSSGFLDVQIIVWQQILKVFSHFFEKFFCFFLSLLYFWCSHYTLFVVFSGAHLSLKLSFSFFFYISFSACFISIDLFSVSLTVSSASSNYDWASLMQFLW